MCLKWMVPIECALAMAFALLLLLPGTIGPERSTADDQISAIVRAEFCNAYLRWVRKYVQPGDTGGLETLNAMCAGYRP